MDLDKIPKQLKDGLRTVVVTRTDPGNKARKSINESMKNNLPPDETCVKIALEKNRRSKQEAHTVLTVMMS